MAAGEKPLSKLLPSHCRQQVARDLLYTLIRTLGGRIDLRPDIAGRGTQAICPPDRGRIEHEIVLGTRINGSSIRSTIWLAWRPLRRTARHHLQAGDGRWVPVIFPTDQAWYRIPGPHARARKQPVVRHSANPVSTASNGAGAMGSNKFVGVRTRVRERSHLFELMRASRRTENSHSLECLQSIVKLNPAANRVAG